MTDNEFLNRLGASLADDGVWGELVDDGVVDGFGVPDGYFDAMEERVMGRVDADVAAVVASGGGEVSVRRRVLLAVVSAAAGLALLVGVGLFFHIEQSRLAESVDGLVASDAEVDALIELLDGEELEDVLADVWDYGY